MIDMKTTLNTQTLNLNNEQNLSQNLALPAIFNCGLLTPENVKAISEINIELSDNWHKRQVFRTETEMRISVLNDGKHPNNASKYWQSVREQAVMLDNLTMLGFDYRRNDLQIRRLRAKLDATEDIFDKEEIQIDLDECMFKKVSMEQSANDRAREIKLWSQIKHELDDGSFDTTDVNIHQAESLLQVLKNRRACLTQSSSQAEVINVLGPLQTAERLLKK